MVNYYKDMWRGRSEALAALTALTSSKRPYQWTVVEQRTFEQVKEMVAKQVLLQYPDYNLPFEVYTDASAHQLGGVIMQEAKPLAFWSKKYNQAQEQYTMNKSELLSIVEVLREFRTILWGENSRMEGQDWAKLEQTVSKIRDNTVSKRSRATYQNTYCRFLAWIARNKSHLFPTLISDSLGDTSATTIQQLRTQIKDIVTKDRNLTPLNFEELQAKDFVTRLVTLERKDGGALSYSALNTHRVGLFNLFRDYSHTMSKPLESELTNYFKGLKHKLAKDAGNGDATVKSGKDPLMFDLYSFLCEKMLGNTSNEMVFAHAYMVIAWNLMFRSSNAFGIRHSHMEWRGDALQIYFAHMKNDQGDEVVIGHVTLDTSTRIHFSLAFLLEKDAKSKTLLRLGLTIEEATTVFVSCANTVEVGDTTERSRKRRRGQLSWATVGKLLRKKQKQQ
ncbi:LOW QUALITY PROTEIN: hypothetical protein PHMEG_00033895 [Phytophthora megakarya]|uniref:Reverse transcriptase/retrotransposon-derived protein RNase H-like domain-containing protein n=1 Tax=Phytophthora megakarya TaxID=4795 RepID=A0A225USG6_9STRA|nr:LOW QUALITY PROTEIN: hypothetical protein PHMEG_00033895 [Phytophthora megakarya]